MLFYGWARTASTSKDDGRDRKLKTSITRPCAAGACRAQSQAALATERVWRAMSPHALRVAVRPGRRPGERTGEKAAALVSEQIYITARGLLPLLQPRYEWTGVCSEEATRVAPGRAHLYLRRVEVLEVPLARTVSGER